MSKCLQWWVSGPVISIVVAGAVFTMSPSFPLHLWATLRAAAHSGGGCWLMLRSAGLGVVAASLVALALVLACPRVTNL